MNNDLISRSALKEEVNKKKVVGRFNTLLLIDNAPTVVVNCKDCDGYEAGYSAGLKDAERPQGEWIPVSERLPEKRGVYIVTEKVFSLDDREHKGRYNTMVEQVEYCNGKWQRARFFEVIAWRPLPEPYKKGGAE